METKEQIQEFCKRYFKASNAPILSEEQGFLQIELPRDVDKEVTDRPYYWMYVESCGLEVPNTILSLSFDPHLSKDDIERLEYVALGSFRLNKIIDSAKRRGRFTRIFQSGRALSKGKLFPLLMVSFKVSFVSARRKEELVSFAVNLCTGRVLGNFFRRVQHIPFSPDIPFYAKTERRKLSVEEGYDILQKALERYLASLDHSWAEEAEKYLQQELDQLETYYDSLSLVSTEGIKSKGKKEERIELYKAEKDLRIEELKWRCEPRIEVDPFHMAFVYVGEEIANSII